MIRGQLFLLIVIHSSIFLLNINAYPVLDRTGMCSACSLDIRVSVSAHVVVDTTVGGACSCRPATFSSHHLKIEVMKYTHYKNTRRLVPEVVSVFGRCKISCLHPRVT